MKHAPQSGSIMAMLQEIAARMERAAERMEDAAITITLDRADEASPRFGATVEGIVGATAEVCQVPRALIMVRLCTPRARMPRFLAYYVARRRTGKSYPELGRAFGKHHASVLHGCREAERLIGSDHVWARAYAAIERRLSE